MPREWTPDQKNAISARGGCVLVSAAAGSGKTAVLTERVVRLLADEKSGCTADGLLVVTFTRAAAAEMRERISARLSEVVRENPSNRHAARQQMLLPSADICTIDSFCGRLVKENFHELGVLPDFRMLDASEAAILRFAALGDVTEKFYSEDSDGSFAALSEIFAADKNDENLGKAILKLYDYACAYPRPEKQLDKYLSYYTDFESPQSSVWGAEILDNITGALSRAEILLTRGYDCAKKDDILCDTYAPQLAGELARVRAVKKLAQGGEWDSLYSALLNFSFERLDGKGASKADENIREQVRQLRDSAKKIILNKTSSGDKSLYTLMTGTSRECAQDIAALRPLAQRLIEAVKAFSARYMELKREENAYEFSDVSLFALKLLYDEQGNASPLSASLSSKYSAVLVDEYQDTNEAQDCLFEAVSCGGKNLFTVGDVKQSIYAFRQAMPEIFLRRRGLSSEYDGESFPAYISLDKNFRSRSGVTDSVNYAFSRLMSPRLGGVDYSARGEKLVAAASYETQTGYAQSEYHVIIPQSGVRTDSEQSRACEGRYIAEIIKDMLRSGVTVQTADGVRAAKYGDFCILLRNLKNKGRVYASALSECGIPVSTVSGDGFFDTAEIHFIISLLRITDNPSRDVELLSVMLSPVFGFLPDDIARYRTDGKGGSLYSDTVFAASQGDAKCSAFLERLRYYRSLSCALDVSELINALYEDTGYYRIAGAMRRGTQRKANLRRMREYAIGFETRGGSTLSGFIRYIDALIERENDSQTSSGAVLGDAVNLMTVHKSKGLEFPFVIIADCSSSFKNSDYTGELILEREMGIGLKRCIPEEMKKFACISHSAGASSVRRSQLSEELRVLYVAMTRAREKLIMTASLTKKSLEDTALDFTAGLGSQAALTATSYAKWLTSAFLTHPDASALREAAGLEYTPQENASGGMVFKVVCAQDTETAEAVSSAQPQISPALTDEQLEEHEHEKNELLEEVRLRADYVYPYAALSRVSAKRTASQGEEGFDSRYFASERPAFMQDGRLTAAQKGTAAHSFLEVCDFAAARVDVEKELRRAVGEGKLSEAQAAVIDTKRLGSFFSGELCARMLSSERVLREYKFTIGLPASELYEGIPESMGEETVVVQGKLDCAFFEDGRAILVDYKTDRVNDAAELRERYCAQLSLYKKALERCEGAQVSEVYLYSVALGEAIKLDI